jgi:hypothetical protein
MPVQIRDYVKLINPNGYPVTGSLRYPERGARSIYFARHLLEDWQPVEELAEKVAQES